MDRKTLSSMVSATNVPPAITSGSLIIAYLKRKNNQPNKQDLDMALWRVTTKRKKLCNGIMIEPNMTVEVVTTGANPVTSNRGQAVADAFMRIYGIDAVKANILNLSDLDVVKVK